MARIWEIEQIGGGGAPRSLDIADQRNDLISHGTTRVETAARSCPGRFQGGRHRPPDGSIWPLDRLALVWFIG